MVMVLTLHGIHINTPCIISVACFRFHALVELILPLIALGKISATAIDVENWRLTVITQSTPVLECMYFVFMYLWLHWLSG